MSKKRKSFNLLFVILGALWGIGFGLFMSRKPGKDLRKEILKDWEDGECLGKAKAKVFFRELYYGIKAVPEMLEEFLDSPKMESCMKKGEELKEKGKKLLDEKFKEGKKVFDKKMKEGKKMVDKKIKDGKKKAEKAIKKIEKKVKRNQKGK